MEPLKTNKLLLMWLSMCAPDKFTSKHIRIAYVGVASTIFALNLFSLISNTFFVIFDITDLRGGLFTFMTINGYLLMIYILINAFVLRHKINELFEKLSEICCESACNSFVQTSIAYQNLVRSNNKLIY